MFTYKKYVYLLLCILLINISCTKTKKEYYPNGKIYTITYYKKQTPYLFEEFSESGRKIKHLYYDKKDKIKNNGFVIYENGDSVDLII